MKSIPRTWCCGSLVVLAFAACSRRDEKGAGSPPPSSNAPAAAHIVLAQDPGQGQQVRAAKAAGPSAATVVTGRVASIVPGRAVFTLMDAELPYCGSKNPEDKCETPWDYCCESSDTRTANALVVEARDAAGQPLHMAALPELRLLDLVSVRGKLQQDEHGNFVLVADGWYRRERPQLPEYVRWPQ